MVGATAAGVFARGRGTVTGTEGRGSTAAAPPAGKAADADGAEGAAEAALAPPTAPFGVVPAAVSGTLSVFPGDAIASLRNGCPTTGGKFGRLRGGLLVLPASFPAAPDGRGTATGRGGDTGPDGG
ncbi:MAG: hypothetical protein JW751_13990 [Polyangiaceae bacterium]|nr:hypothetical protein [Polyangiaceae bacterium]